MADYERAERAMAVREGKRGFVIHAIVYALVMTGLTILNLVLVAQTDDAFVWFPFPLIGWGIGLAMHYLHGVRWAEQETRARQAKVEWEARDLLSRG